MKKKTKKKNIQFPLEVQNETSRVPDSALHFEGGWASYFRHRYSTKSSIKTKLIQR